MLSLKVISESGRPAANPIQAQFGAAGGTIGRSPDCTMALPDPGRHISRLQARIDFASGRYTITCLGSGSSLTLNGNELETGCSSPLQAGDTLVIAQYVLAAEIPVQGGGQTATPPSFGDLPSAPAPAPARSGAVSEIPEDFDPFADDFLQVPSPAAASGPGAPSWPPADPFGAPARRDGAGGQPAGRFDSQARGGFGASGPGPQPGSPLDDPLAAFDFDAPPSGGAPLDDPLGGFGLAPSATPPAAAVGGDRPLSGRDDSVMNAASRQAESLDALFGLGSGTDPLGAGSPLAAPLSGPNTAASHDPLAALSMRPQDPGSAQTLPVRGSELNASFSAPRAIPPAAGAATREAPASSAAGQASPFLSWREPPESTGPAGSAWPGAASAPPSAAPSAAPSAPARPADFERTQLHPSPRSALPEAAASAPGAGAPVAPEARSPVAPASSARPSPVAVADATATEPLLQALLTGLGLDDASDVPAAHRPNALTPELLQRIGELLRVSVQGTVDLLQARATVKREMKAEMTVIVSNDNNPLKFSPDGLSALAHLVSTRSVRGFMAPVPAMRDAYEDLLAHELAFVAGMRAAMQGLIQRFDPQQLESRLTRRSVVDSVIPIARRARLWELFGELFAEISREAEDDFETLFGREFVRAYEAQVERLRDIP